MLNKESNFYFLVVSMLAVCDGIPTVRMWSAAGQIHVADTCSILILSRTLLPSILRSGPLEEVGVAGSIYQFTGPWKGWKLPSSGVVMTKLVIICYNS